MKKITAILLALVMCCGVLAGCGDKGADKESSAAKSDTKVSADEKAEGETSENEDEAEVELTLAQEYSKSLEGKDFRTVMVTSSDFMDDSTTIVQVSGENYYMGLGSPDESMTELYMLDGVMYVLSASEKSYYKDEEPDEQYLNIDVSSYAMGIDDTYVFVSSEETADGLTCETYHAPDLMTGKMPSDDEESEATVYKYYFNKEGGTPVKVEMSAYGLEQTTTFDEFSFEVSAIELPDITGWTDDTEANEGGEIPEGEAEYSDDETETPIVEIEQAEAAETE